ncbi:hypothetical protein D5H78_15405 [Vallicoccus soli]|uniref:Uncharacterized protein n=1 Tax=Vallicoccus soli TaxID=2339232 RepID=A0A3A3YQS3_9ACTN|nr:hypothetical protein D5H78_15405 [Vallicoccus soli]
MAYRGAQESLDAALRGPLGPRTTSRTRRTTHDPHDATTGPSAEHDRTYDAPAAPGPHEEQP